MSEHPFTRMWDQIAALPITAAEKAVLLCFARRSDWDDGGGAYRSVKKIHEETGFAVRTVEQSISSLRCDPFGPCTGDKRCKHRGLLVVVRKPTRFYSTVYDLQLEPRARQMHMPELGPAPQQLERDAGDAAADRTA